MRLTLRTLLSYLDDTLEPSQAKTIGAKVAESEQPRERMKRIKQATRKPAKAAAKEDLDLSSEIDIEQDETLRMGVPAVAGGGIPRNVLLFVGGGVLLAGLFTFAIWQLIHAIPRPETKIIDPIAQGDK